MGNIDRNLQASSPITLVGGDEQLQTNVVREAGQNKAVVTTSVSHFNIIPLIASSNWMNTGAYDYVLPSYSGVENNTLEMSFYYSGFVIGKATIVTAGPASWGLTLERYLLDDDGGNLLDDDGINLNLD